MASSKACYLVMDFFDRQHEAKKNTTWLVLYFGMAVLVMILILYFVAVVGFNYQSRGYDEHGEVQPPTLFQPGIFLIVTFVVCVVVGLGSAYKVMELRAGGQYVAEMLGGHLLQRGTPDPASRQLLNVVEEMALASGVPVPPVYIIEDDSINAFAAGYSPSDAVIGVNRGTVNYLTRDELQGVIAHEFSHILNGDMRLNIRLMGVLHGILMIAIIGYYMMHATSGRRNDKGGGAAIVMLGLAAVVVGYIGVFFGRLIKAAVSRQREYLADASAVQFTRNPGGISGALQKIGGLSYGSAMSSPEAESASHMFFCSALRSLDFVQMFATHPPLEDRIRRVDRNWQGRFPSMDEIEADFAKSMRRFQGSQKKKKQKQEPAQPLDQANILGTSVPGMENLPFGSGDGKIPIDPLLVLAAIGSPAEEHREYSHNLIESLPEVLEQAIHDPFSARCVVFVMLLDEDEEIRKKQGKLIADRDGEATYKETARLVKSVRSQPDEVRLPMIEMIQGTLRSLSPEQYTHFRETVVELVQADDKISMFEFFLQRVLLGHLDRGFFEHKPPRPQYFAIDGVRLEIGTVISTLVHVGHKDEAECREVYGQAVAGLQLSQPPEMLARSDCSLTKLDEALTKLDLCAPPIKKRMISACVLAIAADGEVTVNEAELLRTIADSLDCPMPPLAARKLSQ